MRDLSVITPEQNAEGTLIVGTYAGKQNVLICAGIGQGSLGNSGNRTRKSWEEPSPK